MKLTQGATSTISVVSLLMSAASLAGVVYMVWLEPNRIQLKTEELKAQAELARAQTQLGDRFAEMAVQLKRSQDWWDAQVRREEKRGQ